MKKLLILLIVPGLTFAEINKNLEYESYLGFGIASPDNINYEKGNLSLNFGFGARKNYKNYFLGTNLDFEYSDLVSKNPAKNNNMFNITYEFKTGINYKKTKIYPLFGVRYTFLGNNTDSLNIGYGAGFEYKFNNINYFSIETTKYKYKNFDIDSTTLKFGILY